MVHMVQNRDNIELEIILTLIKNKTHLREIARTINESHSTVLRKINLLLKENTLDYEKEGRNKTYFLKKTIEAKNYVYSAEIYKLSKLLKQYQELSIIFEEVKKIVSKGIIILFGSYAKGIAKKDSDIDIYIETNNTKIKDKLKEISSKINAKIGKFDLNSLLIKEIIKNHVIIRGIEEFYEKSKFFEQA